MKDLDQYLMPYLISQLFAIIILIAAYKNTPLARLLFSILFLWASGTNMYFGITNPNIYLEYSKMALPLYRQFINGPFNEFKHIMVPLIAAGQFLIGIGMILNDRWVKLACIGAIIFLLSITPLMVGSGFPFTIIVSFAAFIVLRKDSKAYLWKKINDENNHINKRPNQQAIYLSLAAGFLAFMAASVGLFVDHIYLDNQLVQAVWTANDWVTLLIVLPALAFTLYQHEDSKLQLVLAGLLGYLLYNYAFYLLGAAFNRLFIFYVGIVSCSFFGLLSLLPQLLCRLYTIKSAVRTKFISLFLIIIALVLIVVELPPTIAFAFNGKLPEIIIKSSHPTSIVYALDLPFIVPLSLLAAYWLWKKKGSGIVLSAIMLVKSAAYGLVLIAGSILIQLRSIDKDPLLPFYVFLSLGGIVGLIVLSRSISIIHKSPEKKFPETNPSYSIPEHSY